MTTPAAATTAEILAARPPKERVDPWRPYAWLVEPECAATGAAEDVATVFLTNRECPFHCLMCDLWKHTLDEPTPRGAVPAQLDFALAQLPPAPHIKLYNSGNFFDPLAIPPEDYPAIAERVRERRTVIVENHPRLCVARVLDFRDGLRGRLEVALGLETAHPDALARLNKQMTVDDFTRAAEWLRRNDVDVRTFILLRPPGMTEAEGVDWAVRSLEVAFAAGAGCCSVIPTRAGNGLLDRWRAQGWFTPPALESLYAVLRRGLELRAGRVFVDLWDVQKLWRCAACGPRQTEALRTMNLTQQIQDWPDCRCARPAA